ncbi:hypothetical protein BCR33DRAFT_715477 [Rhizoclosmatium globosum]|uniref:Uncharacterized protein n=1 Tax=Rhizoclosmatium globosum TaxID=329046 RepID=A0A1Y2CH52_9FUNG|nr:hypothetical protein BCR33DRAFT_715477 [Rhizoclosmatium globosum]|eukprot:ORY46359.1 hypothetical protein BCR33DRAFT_715477 [Rhizoclosmatium globosum]
MLTHLLTLFAFTVLSVTGTATQSTAVNATSVLAALHRSTRPKSTPTAFTSASYNYDNNKQTFVGYQSQVTISRKNVAAQLKLCVQGATKIDLNPQQGSASPIFEMKVAAAPFCSQISVSSSISAVFQLGGC